MSLSGAEIAEVLRCQQGEIQRWSQTVGQVFQDEVEKAIVRGLTDAFRTLAERLPQLFNETCRQHPPSSSDEPAALSLVLPWTSFPEAPETPCAPSPALDKAEPTSETVEQKAAETTLPEQIAASACVENAPAKSKPIETRRVEATAHYRRAMEEVRSGDLERALAHFAHVLRLVPRVATAYLARGRLLHRLGRNDEALVDAEEALRLDPQLSSAYFLRAAVHMRHGDNLRALDDLTRFLDLKPDHALAYHARGLAHANNGEYDLAIGDFGRALRLHPKLLPARYQRALAYRLKGEYAFAVVELTKLLKIQPEFARGYFERALARLALDEHDNAIEDFDKAMELAPQDKEIRARRERAVLARAASRRVTPPTEEIRPKAPTRVSPPPQAPVPRPVAPDGNDPTFLPLTCPGCGAAARISWKRLDRLFRCRNCTRVFRINREGHLTEIDPNPPPLRRSRFLKRAAVLVALCLIVLLAVFLIPKFRHKPALAELPNDLQSRGELWGQAWLNDDRLLLRRLTSPTHDRQLHPWLTRHPLPVRKDREAASQQGSAAPEIHLRVRKTKPHEAVVIVRISDTALKKPQEFQLDWIERGDIWYFVPTLKR